MDDSMIDVSKRKKRRSPKLLPTQSSAPPSSLKKKDGDGKRPHTAKGKRTTKVGKKEIGSIAPYRSIEHRVSNQPASGDTRAPERIAKFLARAGVASRRGAEALISEGKVAVNGKKIDSPALNVSSKDRVTVDGKLVQVEDASRLFLYHKPPGLVTTHRDPEGRLTVFERLPKNLPRLISVGRLDLNSEGLLLLTNSGALAHRIEHPSLGWKRCYRVRFYGELTEKAVQHMARGITIEGMRYRPVEIDLEERKGRNQWALVTLTEGKNREIRKLFAHFDCQVSRLIRLAFGPFQLGNLAQGAVKEVPAEMMENQPGLAITD